MEFTYTGTFNTGLLLDEIEALGIPPGSVRMLYQGDTLTLIADAGLQPQLDSAVTNHDPQEKPIAERDQRDREQIVNLFGLDADDRDFLQTLTQGFNQAAANDVSASVVYNNLRGVVDASTKHKTEIYYWYELTTGTDPNSVLTALQKRRFIDVVRQYYTTKLAPALIVWMTR